MLNLTCSMNRHGSKRSGSRFSTTTSLDARVTSAKCFISFGTARLISVMFSPGEARNWHTNQRIATVRSISFLFPVTHSNMATKKTSSAKRNFCVWADNVRRVYQHVKARSPKAAYAIAKGQPECWEPCDWHDNNGFRLSNEVQDLATEEFTPIQGAKNCRNCGSEIVETINESNFRDGECGPCEYQRYRSQADLLKACEDGTVKNQFLTHKAFRQLLVMKLMPHGPETARSKIEANNGDANRSPTALQR